MKPSGHHPDDFRIKEFFAICEGFGVSLAYWLEMLDAPNLPILIPTRENTYTLDPDNLPHSFQVCFGSLVFEVSIQKFLEARRKAEGSDFVQGYAEALVRNLDLMHPEMVPAVMPQADLQAELKQRARELGLL